MSVPIDDEPVRFQDYVECVHDACAPLDEEED